MSLLWPSALWALGVLLLPILIHLTRRLQRTRTIFAALRWVSATQRPSQRIRLQQLPLLLLRLLMLAVAVLLLARPVLPPSGQSTRWVAVVPGASSALIAAEQQRAGAQARWVWLAPGFPEFSPQSPPPGDVHAAGASLLRELDQSLPAAAQLSVLLPQHWSGQDGQRLRLSRVVRWVLSDPADASPPPPEPATATNQSAAWPSRVLLYADAEGAQQEVYLRAAVAAWNASRPAAPAQPSIELLSLSQADAPALVDLLPDDLLVWASAEALSAAQLRWIAAGGTLLLDARTPLPAELDASHRLALQRSDSGAALVWAAALGQGRIVQLARPLQLEQWPSLAEAQFAQQLRHWLRPPEAMLPTWAAAASVSPQVDPDLPNTPAPRSLHSLLAALLAGLFLLERLCASWLSRSRA